MMTIDQIRAALERQRHEPAEFAPAPHQAAVAMILADGDNGLEVCFILRAERAGDPWSGQVAFPGGRAGLGDSDAHAVAERETWEEIGLPLAPAHRLGPLPVRPVERPEASLTLSPFVYYVGDSDKAAARARQRHEVAAVFWVPLRHLFDAAAATELEYSVAGAPTLFPGIKFKDHVIWGLTLRVLDSFADITRGASLNAVAP